MYFNKFVAYLESDGTQLRERGEKVYLPFGSEYSLIFKNLNTRLAVVNVYIDGEDVLDGQQLVVNPNSLFRLDGFLNGLHAKNKFKFIEKTRKIEEYRGNKPEDGLIKIEFKFEKDMPEKENYVITWNNTKTYTSYPSALFDVSNLENNTGRSRGSCVSSFASVTNCCNTYGSIDNTFQNSDGITVKGSEIYQHFNRTWVGELESECHTIIFQLCGFNKNNQKIEKPFTIKDKVCCKTCGQKNDYRAKFCSECGTFLET